MERKRKRRRARSVITEDEKASRDASWIHGRLGGGRGEGWCGNGNVMMGDGTRGRRRQTRDASGSSGNLPESCQTGRTDWLSGLTGCCCCCLEKVTVLPRLPACLTGFVEGGLACRFPQLESIHSAANFPLSRGWAGDRTRGSEHCLDALSLTLTSRRSPRTFRFTLLRVCLWLFFSFLLKPRIRSDSCLKSRNKGVQKQRKNNEASAAKKKI